MPSSPFGSSSVVSLVIAALKVVLTYPLRIAAARRTMGQVGRMSDYELKDIGLSRQDVWDAGNLPFGTDPGRLFQARVNERLQARLDRRAERAAHAVKRERPMAWKPLQTIKLQSIARVADRASAFAKRPLVSDVSRP